MSKKKRTKNRRKTTKSAPSSSPPRQLSWQKKLLFSAISLILIFAVAEMALALAGVEPQLKADDPFVGFADQVPLLAKQQRNGETVMVTAPNKLKWFNQQSFSNPKAKDVYRIFTVGGSTTYGRPYTDPTSFSGWLRELLPEADPSRKWEVINAGGISYASYRVVRVMEELAEFQPDAFVVYTGHNEFLEERTYRDVREVPAIVRSVSARLGRTRVYSAMHRLVHTSAPNSGTDGEVLLDREVKARLDAGVGPDAYERDDALASQIEEHFRYNLKQMIDVARRSGAQIIFVTPASNLADCSPFKSLPNLARSEQEEWKASLQRAEDALAADDHENAVQAIENALSLEDRDAHTHYVNARILAKKGEYEAAKLAFARARDEDVCPLRATTNLVNAVSDVAKQNDVPVIDFVNLLESRSDHHIPNESLFLDHVHPTIEGHRLLALAVVDELIASGVVKPAATWNDEAVARVVQQVESQIDQQTQGQALRNLAKVLTWAGKTEEANRLALKASAMLSGDDETYYLAGNALLEKNQISEAIEQFQKALSIRPDHLLALNSLATAYYQSDRTDEAIKTYQQVLQVDPSFVAVHNNLGSILQGRQQYEQAEHHFREAIRLNPRYAQAYNNMGVMLRNQERLDQAQEMFQQAVDIDPEYAEAHYNLGLIDVRQGREKQAMKRFRDCIRLNPRYGPAYHQIGIRLEANGQIGPAARAYRQSLRNPPASRDASRRLAWILATSPDNGMRNGRAALGLIQGAIQATPAPSALQFATLAAAFGEVGDFTQAVEAQRKAVQLADDDEQKTQMENQLAVLESRRPIRNMAGGTSANWTAGKAGHAT